MTPHADRADIIELFGRYADIADTGDFDALPRLVHTDPFTVDFSSVAGIPPTQTPLDAYAEVLRRSFAPFAATHHAITGHVIDLDGDRARARAHVRAEHWLPEEAAQGGPNRWLVVGFYDNEAVRTGEGWRFSRVALRAVYQENAHLLGGAAGHPSKHL
ncbi:nuclear transport factor 2 family protein [Streptomonospora sp. S1-112]|uniref:Nuclear transport factor 2 family protein n=1 Tax=Streptomonospora mangrovi TaxID=2883123 RepID=A0A9X3NGQ0_9ACTN|nr:nuclear transport factor 2 family protein [Streptomonospora mangrovi]MDA0563389.1 nuclear transport factor 2 family protein [Streptomonospora mangrovi]